MSDLAGAVPPLRIDNVCKRFRQGPAVIDALDGISLLVDRGEFVAVMGASGSGKSTLLHAMAGLTRPDQGGVFVEGSDLSTMSDRSLTIFRRRRIGIVFQAFNLIPTLSAYDNILLPALADRRDRHWAQDRASALIARLGLTDRRRSSPNAMSGGEQQRVAIARAMMCDPAIVLADEPTGSLDSVTGQDICRLLRQLCREQRRTIVVVTHEPTVAVWADRIVVLKDGHVLTEFQAADFRDAHSLAAHYHDVVGGKTAAEAAR
jgi:putative ABC transport system ATP-binding protein